MQLFTRKQMNQLLGGGPGNSQEVAEGSVKACEVKVLAHNGEVQSQSPEDC